MVFYNTWTDTVIQQVEGRCSIQYAERVSVICKVGEKHGKAIVKNNLISLSGQVTVFVEQLEDLPVNTYHYRRTFKPQGLLPDVDLRMNGSALMDAVTPDLKD